MGMMGILIFQQVYLNLSEKCRNKVLGNIFGICDVSVSDVFVEETGIVFRVFSKGVFYQYSFRLGMGENKVLCSSQIVNRLIYISNVVTECDNNFIYRLIELFRCQDEYQIYQMMRVFL